MAKEEMILDDEAINSREVMTPIVSEPKTKKVSKKAV